MADGDLRAEVLRVYAPVYVDMPAARETRPWVINLEQANKAYWDASTPREHQAAYHEVLLFGGRDGYSGHGVVRAWVVRTLRRLAARLDDGPRRETEASNPNPEISRNARRWLGEGET